MRIGLVLLLAVCVAVPAGAAERRCGWLDNPTPANWSLTDRSGEWTLSQQGSFEAPGFDTLPDLGRPHGAWIITNVGDYGYGCACITGIWNMKTMEATRLISWSRLPLARCRADKQLTRR